MRWQRRAAAVILACEVAAALGLAALIFYLHH